MCGIAGVWAYHYAANGVERAELLAMRDHMARRGPDGSGIWLGDDERIGLTHRRLAIIDLSDNGLQPMHTEDRRFVITFNGEIYNYKELRRALIAKGYRFRTDSDTEVLLHLYAERGVEMVRELRGMFAFALWDARERLVVLARDPYGIKPLYYSDDGWTCRFASQVKALVAGGAISAEPDPAGQVGFYLFGSVPEPFTTLRAIRSVPSGSTIVVDRKGPALPRRYHSIASVYRDAERKNISTPDERGATRDALLDSVRSHLVADVPVGAFLSSGIDSGALVGLMRDAGAGEIRTVTIGFDEFRGAPQDETPFAAEVARQYDTKHTTRVITRAEFEADLPRIMDAMDQPSIDGVNTWFVAKAARELGLKVAVSGLGGDELFGGYPSFRDVPGWVRAFAVPSRIPLLGFLSRKIAGRVTDRVGANPKAAGLLEYGGTYAGAYLLRRGLFMPWDLGQVLDRDIVEQGLRRLKPLRLIDAELHPRPRGAFARVATLESSLYMRNQLLRDTDWAGMAHSLEVRVPLVDSVLLAKLAPWAKYGRRRQGKRFLAAAPSRALPEAVISRAKTGFTTPIETWMASHIRARKSERQTAAASPGPWARDWSRIVSESNSLGEEASIHKSLKRLADSAVAALVAYPGSGR
jgi:asparagine synthase (glutamine-hydrolysing)